jgi:hypothetical protein
MWFFFRLENGSDALAIHASAQVRDNRHNGRGGLGGRAIDEAYVPGGVSILAPRKLSFS